VITNIDVDHLDYYKDEADYLSAFVSLVSQTRYAVVLSALDPGCIKLYETVPESEKVRLKWYLVTLEEFTEKATGQSVKIPKLHLKVPGEHLRLDANLAYTVGELMGILPENRVQ